MRLPASAAYVARTVLFLLVSASAAAAAIEIRAPQVEYRATPLGIDVARPRFSWHLEATSGERGVVQQAYQVVVTAPGGRVTWDTGRIAARTSIGLAYDGEALATSTRYAWQVTVWLQDGSTRTAS